MPDITPNLALPFILPSQAQKHVTHNEALLCLDAVTQLVLVGMASTPPGDPTEGTCWLVQTDATGDWAGQDDCIAVFQDGAWAFLAPRPGWVAWFSAISGQRVFDGSGWVSPLKDDILGRVGINASADDVNRLTVASDTSLFTHAGTDHRLKLNKAGFDNTASVLLQSGWSGRAEIGLTGSDDLRFKVSADGSFWRDALAIAASGVVRQPHRPIVRAAFDASTPSPAAGDATGFHALTSEQGGFVLGTPVPSGSGNRLVVPESGLYLALLTLEATAVTGSYSARAIAHGTGSTVMAALGGNAPGHHTGTGLLLLAAGDGIDVEHQGIATFDLAADASHLVLIFIA